MKDRTIRSKGIIVYNVIQSSSKTSSERLEHDAVPIYSLFNDVEIHPDNTFKVFRIFHPELRPRPVKVDFSE